MKHRYAHIVAVVVLAALVSGCNLAGKDIHTQSQQAAKNWFSVIRGAQVFPLNPLREDLQPGDVFVVTETIEQQSNSYKADDYLPLDQHLYRITTGAQEQDAPLPMAGMPSFSFTVDRAAGAQINLPVDGIPVGLGLVGSTNVAVSLAISNATSKSAYIAELYPALQSWASTNSTLLARMRAVTRAPLMLRVVNRVYYTKGVTASITALDSGGASLAVGGGAFESNATMLNLLAQSIADTNSTKRFDALANELGKVKPLEVELPGGKASYMRTASNTISMNQVFAKPLAVGYTGFDVAIDKNGALGPPMGSLQNLEDRFQPPCKANNWTASIWRKPFF